MNMSFVKHIFNKDTVEKLTFSDVDRLRENETKEFLNLDYEEIPQKFLKFKGLAEHVSGFLNTSGGVIVYGLSEKKIKGHIITISSIAGLYGTPFFAAYCASKHGVTGFQRSLKWEIRKHGIKVSTIYPGRVVT